MKDKLLIEEAKKAQAMAYVPYSQFKVGCAIYLKDGQVIHGANIENASYGLTNCAERSALFAAYSKGYRKNDIEKIAIIGDGEAIISPCGACRQVMHELVSQETKIMLSNHQDQVKIVHTDELLPFSFTEDYLK